MTSTPTPHGQPTMTYTPGFLEPPEAGPSTTLRPGQSAQRRARARGSSPSGAPGQYRIRTHYNDKEKKWKVHKPRDPSTERAPILLKPSPGRVRQTESAAQGQGQPDDQNDDDAYILVMGPSGAGKTSFINLASDSHLPVSSGLGSCTSDISISEPFVVEGQRVRLIDTPGFDDSYKSEGDVLTIVAEFLARELRQGRRIRSILYLHRISDVRMTSASKKNLQMFQRVIGTSAFPNVIFVTTRWNEVNVLAAESRENELRSKSAYFKPLVEAGAQTMRYMRTPEGARTILRQALECSPIELAIQRQMVAEGKELSETDAGMKTRWVEKNEGIERCKEVLKGLVQQIEILKEINDIEGLKGIEGDVKELKDKVRELQEENQRLLSRRSSEGWEIIDGDVRYIYDEASLFNEPPPVGYDDDDDDDPTIIGGIRWDKEDVYPRSTDSTTTWCDWAHTMLSGALGFVRRVD